MTPMSPSLLVLFLFLILRISESTSEVQSYHATCTPFLLKFAHLVSTNYPLIFRPTWHNKNPGTPPTVPYPGDSSNPQNPDKGPISPVDVSPEQKKTIATLSQNVYYCFEECPSAQNPKCLYACNLRQYCTISCKYMLFEDENKDKLCEQFCLKATHKVPQLPTPIPGDTNTETPKKDEPTNGGKENGGSTQNPTTPDKTPEGSNTTTPPPSDTGSSGSSPGSPSTDKTQNPAEESSSETDTSQKPTDGSTPGAVKEGDNHDPGTKTSDPTTGSGGTGTRENPEEGTTSEVPGEGNQTDAVGGKKNSSRSLFSPREMILTGGACGAILLFTGVFL